MTLGVAWLRNRGDLAELLVASDSRLSAGPESWDASPKILSFPRSDAVMAFSGVTEFAYPVLLQVGRAIEAHPAMVDRRDDITDLSGLVTNIINQMAKLVTTESSDNLQHTLRHTQFILAGYSWRLGRFVIFRYALARGSLPFIRSRNNVARGFGSERLFRFIGGPSNAARDRLRVVLEERGTIRGRGLDMEPLEVLNEFIKSPDYPDVGGSPQILKVYRHMNTQVFGVRSSIRGAELISYAGRPLLEYERLVTPIIDLDDPGAHSRAGRIEAIHRPRENP
jgi:hypothetical protein